MNLYDFSFLFMMCTGIVNAFIRILKDACHLSMAYYSFNDGNEFFLLLFNIDLVTLLERLLVCTSVKSWDPQLERDGILACPEPQGCFLGEYEELL